VHVLRRWERNGSLLPHEKTENGGQNYYVESQLKKALELKIVYESNRKKWGKEKEN